MASMAMGPASIRTVIRDSILQCPICLEDLSNPRTLPCKGLHIFCCHCLDKLPRVAHPQGGRHCIECPCCRDKVRIPPGGVEYFQKARDHIELSRILQRQDSPSHSIELQNQPSPPQPPQLPVAVEARDHPQPSPHRSADVAEGGMDVFKVYREITELAQRMVADLSTAQQWFVIVVLLLSLYALSQLFVFVLGALFWRLPYSAYQLCMSTFHTIVYSITSFIRNIPHTVVWLFSRLVIFVVWDLPVGLCHVLLSAVRVAACLATMMAWLWAFWLLQT